MECMQQCFLTYFNERLDIFAHLIGLRLQATQRNTNNEWDIYSISDDWCLLTSQTSI